SRSGWTWNWSSRNSPSATAKTWSPTSSSRCTSCTDRTSNRSSQMDVAIIGIGIHPFGRTEGVSGLDQGVYAARQALKDAGIEWKDLQFAYGGSSAAGNADSMVSK